MVGFYHVADAMEELCVGLHAYPPFGDWMVRAPGDEDLKRGGCCSHSTATTMEGKSGATFGSHKFFFRLKLGLFSTALIASCMPWCSLPWTRNEFPRQVVAVSVLYHKPPLGSYKEYNFDTLHQQQGSAFSCCVSIFVSELRTHGPQIWMAPPKDSRLFPPRRARSSVIVRAALNELYYFTYHRE